MDHKEFFILPKYSGWGGRDRTYECRNQNPVPYHLATPQYRIAIDSRLKQIQITDADEFLLRQIQ